MHIIKICNFLNNSLTLHNVKILQKILSLDFIKTETIHKR